mgnify:CR=1 FL=1
MSSNTKPIGVAYEDQNIRGADVVLSAGQLGYSTAAQGAVTQGAVTQATSKSTGVTLNASSGVITTNAASLATTIAVSFTLTNSVLTAKSVLAINVASGGTAAAYLVFVSSMAAGSCVITLVNRSGGDLAEAVVLNYAVIHAE